MYMASGLSGAVHFVRIAHALNNQVHLAALGLETLQILPGAGDIDVVKRVDAKPIALVQHLANALLRVILLHDGA